MAEDKKGVSPLATGVAGAIIGAAATAAAIALSDEKNRKKVEEVLGNLEKEGSNVLKEIRNRAMQLKDTVSKTAKNAESKTKNINK